MEMYKNNSMKRQTIIIIISFWIFYTFHKQEILGMVPVYWSSSILLELAYLTMTY